jgi:uncharacterized protein (TIGR02594 family)
MSAIARILGWLLTLLRRQPAPPAPPAEPRWMAVARAELGQKEVPGPASNSRISAYFTATHMGSQPDHVPWCGAFVAWCLRQAGVLTRGSARAADWLAWGETLAEPRIGCVVVLAPQAPGASGHVGFLADIEDGHVIVLGGNQSDAVTLASFPRSQVRGWRWPVTIAVKAFGT